MNDTASLNNPPPVILSFSALDPSGRGGIQADIEVAASLCCHCTPVLTALCSSGDSSSTEVYAVESALIIQQARSILEDIDVAAIKIGYLGSIENVEAVHAILNDYAQIPVILQPMLCLLDETDSAQLDLVASISNLIVPESDIIITSLEEARLLSSSNDTTEATALALLDEGPSTILLNSADLKARRYEHRLFDARGQNKVYTWSEDKAPQACSALKVR